MPIHGFRSIILLSSAYLLLMRHLWQLHSWLWCWLSGEKLFYPLDHIRLRLRLVYFAVALFTSLTPLFLRNDSLRNLRRICSSLRLSSSRWHLWRSVVLSVVNIRSAVKPFTIITLFIPIKVTVLILVSILVLIIIILLLVAFRWLLFVKVVHIFLMYICPDCGRVDIIRVLSTGWIGLLAFLALEFLRARQEPS